MSIDFQAMRVEYGRKTLDEMAAGGDPMAVIAAWLAEAQAAGIREPNAMTLATVGPDGAPAARVMLLKGLDDRGFVFFSHYRSAKGRQIDADPRAAIVLCWVDLERQVRVEGRIERLSAAESDAYFATRPRGAQLVAWAAEQSAPVESREELYVRYEAARDRFQKEEAIPRPETWGGYRLVPGAIELWQGRESRMHDRMRFERAGAMWRVVRLQP